MAERIFRTPPSDEVRRLHEAQGAALALEDQRIQGEAARCDEVMAWDDLRSKLRRVFAEVGAAPPLGARG